MEGMTLSEHLSNINEINKYYFLQGKIPFNFGMLVVLAVGFRIVGYFALLAKTFRKSS